MRCCLPLLLALGLFGAARASENANAENEFTRWVRTTRGWETLASLDSSPSPGPNRVAIHPGVIAAGQLCGSLLALLAFAPQSREALSVRASRHALASVTKSAATR